MRKAYKMADVCRLNRAGFSHNRIAKTLSMHPKTVGRLLGVKPTSRNKAKWRSIALKLIADRANTR